MSSVRGDKRMFTYTYVHQFFCIVIFAELQDGSFTYIIMCVALQHS